MVHTSDGTLRYSPRDLVAYLEGDLAAWCERMIAERSRAGGAGSAELEWATPDDLLAALLHHHYPVTFEQLIREVPADTAEQKEESRRRTFERDKDELRGFRVPMEAVADDMLTWFGTTRCGGKDTRPWPEPRARHGREAGGGGTGPVTLRLIAL